jgi:hypothetical protein
VQRQLNIGGSCPGGYVCCRSPRQNNNFNNNNNNNNRPQSPQSYPQNQFNNNNNGHSTNQFQQVAPNPLGQQNSFNQLGGSSFNQGYGECGVRNARGITGRVTNPGHVDGDTDYGEYPWQVAILKKDGYDNVYVCGGALIGNRHVLTAA